LNSGRGGARRPSGQWRTFVLAKEIKAGGGREQLLEKEGAARSPARGSKQWFSTATRWKDSQGCLE